MPDQTDQSSQPSDVDAPLPARDLVDFHLRWREFRDHAHSAATAQGLTPLQAETVNWLIRMADRIGKDDVEG